MVIIGFCAPSKTGKTTFLEHLIPSLIQDHRFQGKIGVIKHCHHNLSNHHNSDSNRLQRAGAHHVQATTESNFDHVLSSFPQCNLILVEGFRSAPIPFFLLKRQREDKQWKAPSNIITTIDLTHFETSIQQALTTIHRLLLAQ